MSLSPEEFLDELTANYYLEDFLGMSTAELLAELDDRGAFPEGTSQEEKERLVQAINSRPAG